MGNIVFESNYPWILCLLPFILAVYIVLTSKLKNKNFVRDMPIVFAGFVFTISSVEVMLLANGGFISESHSIDLFDNVGLQLRIDFASSLFLFVIATLWFATSIYSLGYMRSLKEHSQTRFYVFFAIAIFASVGVAFSANLLTLFIFYEILSLSTYPLVTHHQNGESRLSGRKYVGYLLGGSVGLVLPAMIYIYIKTGTLDFSPNGILANASFSNVEIFVLLAMFVFGFAKCAIMPMHTWLPNAMVAPTPVSALLHAVAVVKVGVFSIFRVVFFIFGANFLSGKEIFGIKINLIFCVLAGITILLGSLFAMYQDNFKRRLAYSTISQLSYILLGIFVLKPVALVGALFYLVVHAFSKITLFYTAGAVLVNTGKKNISEMKGLGYLMPVTFTCFLISSLSLMGLPPSGGFIGKLMLINGAISNKAWVMVIYLISSFLASVYLIPVMFEVFKKQSKDERKEETQNLSKKGFCKTPLCCLFPIIFTAFMSIVLFFGSGFLVNFISKFVSMIRF